MPDTEWTTFEKLLLAQAVFKCGDSNWVAVSRTLKQHPINGNRPQDFFSQRVIYSQCFLGRIVLLSIQSYLKSLIR
jgi:hypothetical protein